MTDNDPDGDELIYELSKLTEVAYQRRRKDAARELGMRVDVLDKIIRQARAQAEEDATALPHWNVEPWDRGRRRAAARRHREIFRRYIVLPKGADKALALWVLHAWTVDAGDISPFMVLVSPTKRCGKTSVLIVLLYLTPRSELASNISPSALFRYVEEVRPTLLIDEADSFVKDNEEMRGILNSGHTKAAAYVIRNVEVNGEHKPQPVLDLGAEGNRHHSGAGGHARGPRRHGHAPAQAEDRQGRAAAPARQRGVRDPAQSGRPLGGRQLRQADRPGPEHPRRPERPRGRQLATPAGDRRPCGRPLGRGGRGRRLASFRARGTTRPRSMSSCLPISEQPLATWM